MFLKSFTLVLFLISSSASTALAIPAKKKSAKTIQEAVYSGLPTIKKMFPLHRKQPRMIGTPPVFDIPLTYNHQVKKWIRFYQTNGRSWFKKWLERSTRYSPYIRKQLKSEGMPQDLLYVAMIESGFSSHATSTAQAAGVWQFIPPTARQYGLKINWWLDERRNYMKSTRAAIRYKKDLYKMFHSWYLVAASYNTGEGRISRLIRKHGTNDFWELAKKKVIAKETINYVPKIIAAALISKSPALYGFRNLKFKLPRKYESVTVPGGTDLENLAKFLKVNSRSLKDLNPELVKGFIPRSIKNHKIKVPVGAKSMIARYLKATGSRHL